MMAGKVDPKLLTLVQLVSSGISLEQHDSSLEETFNLCNEYFYSDVLFSNYHSLKDQNGFTISLLNTVLNDTVSKEDVWVRTTVLDLNKNSLQKTNSEYLKVLGTIAGKRHLLKNLI